MSRRMHNSTKSVRRTRRSSKASTGHQTYAVSLFSEEAPKLVAGGGIDRKHRVQVSVRCRPANEKEINHNEYSKVVNGSVVQGIPCCSLDLDSLGKKRHFYFDNVFMEDTNQKTVYDDIGKDIVDDVLNGLNGCVLAYGQTGTGKTYTMGILDKETTGTDTISTGIIPRALKDVFTSLKASKASKYSVSMSFLQIYLETVQDLFAIVEEGNDEQNLAVRESPQKGFYVEDLKSFEVRNFTEAQELLQWGLMKRVMGPTSMNVTSSRSHTLLTVHVRQEFDQVDDEPSKVLNGKLVLVDLAGSERVRRTSSSGARLEEAKSINVSLSALGNVIAALSDDKVSHVPYRDSKLTKLLHDVLSGNATTHLVATLGPSSANGSESLSTLLFAERCMHVGVNPVRNEEIDHSQLCVKLQAQLSNVESKYLERENELRSHYEAIIADLQAQNDVLGRGQSAQTDATNVLLNQSSIQPQNQQQFNDDFGNSDNLKFEMHEPSQMLSLVAHTYESLCDLYDQLLQPIRSNQSESLAHHNQWMSRVEEMEQRKNKINQEKTTMMNLDPMGPNANVNTPQLQEMTERDAMDYVAAFAPSNNIADEECGLPIGLSIETLPVPSVPRQPLHSFANAAEFIAHVNHILSTASANSQLLMQILALKDRHFHKVKGELVSESVKIRMHEEETVNWSHILQHLLKTNGDLRNQLQSQQVRSLQTPVTTPAQSVISRVDTPGSVLSAFENNSTVNRLQARFSSKSVISNLTSRNSIINNSNNTNNANMAATPMARPPHNRTRSFRTQQTRPLLQPPATPQMLPPRYQSSSSNSINNFQTPVQSNSKDIRQYYSNTPLHQPNTPSPPPLQTPSVTTNANTLSNTPSNPRTPMNEYNTTSYQSGTTTPIQTFSTNMDFPPNTTMRPIGTGMGSVVSRTSHLSLNNNSTQQQTPSESHNSTKTRLKLALEGQSPLEDIPSLLEQLGADVNTPLFTPGQNGDFNCDGKGSATPLHVAAAAGRSSCCLSLLRQGGDPSLRDSFGRSVMDVTSCKKTRAMLGAFSEVASHASFSSSRR